MVLKNHIMIIGQLREKGNYIDGLIQGIFKSYDGNGQLFEEVNYSQKN
jgi:antitoxin component YwqK of YwqJK toxin-antitoxin module